MIIETLTVALPSGKTAVIRTGTAMDAVKAQMMVREPEELWLALISILCEVDGARLAVEDVGLLPIGDYFTMVPFLGVSQPLPQGSPLPSAGSATSGTMPS